MDEILGHQQRVLVAIKNGKIVGTLIVSAETEAEGVGNVGYTCVASNETHQGIATNMVKLGTRYLKDIGLKEASLSYTYSAVVMGTGTWVVFVYAQMPVLRLLKWNMGRISRFPLLTLNAFSTTCKMAGRRQT